MILLQAVAHTLTQIALMVSSMAGLVSASEMTLRGYTAALLLSRKIFSGTSTCTMQQALSSQNGCWRLELGRA